MKDREFETLGIILEIKNHNDNDGILKILINDGIRFLYAKGIQKSQSKNKLNTPLLGLVNLEIIKSKFINKISTLKRAKVISVFPMNPMLQNIYNLVLYFLNYINNKNLDFNKYRIFLESVERNPNQSLSYLLLEILRVFGMKPNFESCVECKNKTNIIDFEFYKGGYLCKEHSNNYKNSDYLRALYWLEHDFSIFIKDFDENISIKINAEMIEILKSII
ncbi:DNA repair protein RecO [Metamycoplasma auris]|uniref:DNA replication and repair protein RecO n=1 Tax=Metamycoplasma auris TaxID=51363 RepID=A0A2W7I257_9BACT|nr:DNA repair protein RecO [Metamycoplasma auris]PZW01516.1 DNA replication and repair protein RecO [Metamycoplasma auris]